MKNEQLERIEPRTLRENVTSILRQSIINGSLPPGSELNQVQIAEQLGTSRGPVNEALGQLEQEGLIENIPYKGVLVTPLSERYVEEIYSVNAALEKLSLGRAIDNMNDEEIAELDSIVDQISAAAKLGSLEDLVALDLAFHEYIMRQADHNLSWKLWQQLEIGVQRCLHVRHETLHIPRRSGGIAPNPGDGDSAARQRPGLPDPRRATSANRRPHLASLPADEDESETFEADIEA
ncbi:MAG: GntR family transcriptional regulator [Caldilineaceae bacterium]